MDEFCASEKLTVSDHNRNITGMKYIYPVISRRAKGVSIGINLSPNNACNWRCEYCQVPNLARGSSPPVDFAQFEVELEQLTNAICHGSFLADHAPPEARVLRDFAFSGNGEPTSCPDFPAVVRRVADVRSRYGLSDKTALVLITNGSLVHRASVREALQTLSEANGEVWFKLDRGSDDALASTNGTAISLEKQVARLCQASTICRTRVQSCWYTKDGLNPTLPEVDAWVGCLQQAIRLGATLVSIQLYTLARQPLLPEGGRLGPVSDVWLAELGSRLSNLGLVVDT
jgi:hypothetical protein